MHVKKMLATAVVVASLSVGGAAIAGAATSTSTTSSATAPQTTMPAHGTAAHEDAEKAVTGDAAAKAQAAAVKEVGSGTAGAVTTDFSGNGYEVVVTKSDGSTVEVHLDSSFNVMQMPHGPGGPSA
jgi:nicotinic acid phosphoribosyltransferase